MRVMCIWFCIVFSTALNAHGFEPDWRAAEIMPRDKGGVWLNGINGGIRIWPRVKEECPGLVKVSVVDGCLKVDTTAYHEKFPKGQVILNVNIPQADYFPGKKMVLTLQASSEPAGRQGRLFYEGDSGGKHYHKAVNVLVGSNMQTFELVQALPDTLEKLSLRFDFLQGGVYLLGKASISEVQKKIVDTQKNHIVNGGAESGLYNTSHNGMRMLGRARDGVHVSWNKHQYINAMTATADDRVFHSGRKSFRLDCPDNSINQFYFNPVPIIEGQPATLTLWAKALKPTSIGLCLFPCNGVIYAQTVKVGTEWEKHTLHIPDAGKKPEGVSMHGNPAQGGIVFPRINLQDNTTVWLDDVAYTLGDEAEFKDGSDVWVTGKLDNPKAYYFTDEKVGVKMDFSPAKPGIDTARVGWEILNYRGSVVASSKAETVSLPSTRDYVITPPSGLRGPLNLRFLVKTDNGRENFHTFYFGIIDRSGSPVKRFGMNADGANVKEIIPYFRDFRLGAVRLWGDREGEVYRDAKYFKDADIYVLFIILGLSDKSFLLPKDYTDVKKLLAKNLQYSKGYVDTYEILNEPNICSGRVKNPDPEKYTEFTDEAVANITKAVAGVIRTVDPTAKLGGPCPCGTSADYVNSILSLGTDKIYDVITEHPYRQLPELPDYGDDIRTLHAVLSRYERKYLHYATESGRIIPSSFSDNMIPQEVIIDAARDIRNAVIAYANGVDKYFQFQMGDGAPGRQWLSLLNGNQENDCMMLPAPYLFAARAAADRLEEAPAVVRVTLGVNYRCYIFDRGEVRVAVMWKWNGKEEKIRFDEEMDCYDFMGNQSRTDTFELGECPTYVESTASAQELSELIKAAKIMVSGEVFSSQLDVLNKNQFAITIKNLIGEPIGGTVEIISDGIVSEDTIKEFESIPAEGSGRIVFNTASMIGQNEIALKYRVALPAFEQEKDCNAVLRAILVPHSSKPLVVDGKLDDWPRNAAVTNLNSSNAVKLQPWSARENRISAQIRYAWTQDRLYVAATVRKSGLQSAESSALWKGDSLQIGMDTMRNAVTGSKYQNDDFEYLIARSNGESIVNRCVASAYTYDSLSKNIGIAEDVECAIREYPDRTVYEIGFARLSVSPFKLVADSAMRMNVIINIGNGKERCGWLEVTPGIGQFPKDPASFMDIVLLPQDK